MIINKQIMRSLCFLTALSAIYSFSSAYADEIFEYINVPKANQRADLADDDYDGVINARDLCIGTPADTVIDNNGCSVKIQNAETLLLVVLFDNDSATISPEFLEEIDNMVNFLRTYPETTVELQGYASSVGNRSYNLALSIERAEAVRGKLLRSGVAISRIKVVGHGYSSLDTPQAHTLNRRVTARVIGYESDVLRKWTIFTRRPKE